MIDGKKVDISFTFDELDFLMARMFSDDDILKSVYSKEKFENLFDSITKKIAKEKHQLINEMIKQKDFNSVDFRASFELIVKDLLKYGVLNRELIYFTFDYLDYLIDECKYLEIKSLCSNLYNFLIDKVKN